MLHDFFPSADLVEHLVVTHVDNYSFLIMEYSMQKPLQNRKTLTRDSSHGRILYFVY